MRSLKPEAVPEPVSFATMQSLNIHLIAAARPNFMKVAPLYHALKRESWCRPLIVHTGQHYDPNMSDAFFADLRLPEPDHHLEVGSGTHAEQTGRVMIAYEKVCMAARPDWIVVVGDVNSTAACAMVGAKLCIPVVHLEAGLRSRDRTMPEEINRLVTDAIADVLWTPSADADENLKREGVPAEKIDFIGNMMIDSYELQRSRIEADGTRQKMGLKEKGYGVVTLHRPSNVDTRESLVPLMRQLELAARELPLLFAVHPRTRKKLEEFGLCCRLQSGPDPDRAAGIRAIHESGERLTLGDYRFRRSAGRDDVSRDSLPHVAREHGTAGDFERRNQPTGERRHAACERARGAQWLMEYRTPTGEMGWKGGGTRSAESAAQSRCLSQCPGVCGDNGGLEGFLAARRAASSVTL